VKLAAGVAASRRRVGANAPEALLALQESVRRKVIGVAEAGRSVPAAAHLAPHLLFHAL